MSDMGWSQYIRGLDDAAEQEMQAEQRNMLPALLEFCDYDRPHEMYRTFYKYTPCGPHMSVLVNGGWVHCGELHALGTWKSMAEKGMIVEALLFGSIVEGVDQCAENVEVRLANVVDESGKSSNSLLMNAIRSAVERVDDDASSIWMATHGCDTCIAHWGDGSEAVWDECPACKGEGVII